MTKITHDIIFFRTNHIIIKLKGLAKLWPLKFHNMIAERREAWDNKLICSFVNIFYLRILYLGMNNYTYTTNFYTTLPLQISSFQQ